MSEEPNKQKLVSHNMACDSTDSPLTAKNKRDCQKNECNDLLCYHEVAHFASKFVKITE